MIGKHNSFFSRLLIDSPTALLLPCTCHSMNLIANKACHNIPPDCQSMLTDIGTYFSESPKSCAELKEFQKYYNINELAILRPARTRWLSLQPCIERILNNWKPLEEFFRVEVFDKKRKLAEKIFSVMINGNTKPFLYFLNYVLSYFNNINRLFQSRQFLLHIMSEELKKIIYKIGQNFLKDDILIKGDLSIDDISDSKNFLPLLSVYVGPECEKSLEFFDEEDIKFIKESCRLFYITTLKEILRRFSNNLNLFSEMKFLDPEMVASTVGRNIIPNLDGLASQFNIDKKQLELEWREIHISLKNMNEKKKSLEKTWAKIAETKDFMGQPCFPNLCALASIILSLPHSNAEAERIFSIVTDIKTKKRNRLSNLCLKAICIIRTSLISQNLDCVTFTPDVDHFKLFATNEFNK